MLTASLCCTNGYNLSDYSNLAFWQLKPFSSCLLLSCLFGFTCAGLTAPQLFSYILFLWATLPAPKWFLLQPLPSWLWRNSWKCFSFCISSLSQVLAYTTGNPPLAVFPSSATFFSLSINFLGFFVVLFLSLAWEDIEPNRMTTAVASFSTKQISFCWTKTEQAIMKRGRVRKKITEP